MTDKIPITISGKEMLEAELFRLKNEERPRVIAQISEARSHGDLKENAEYHAAKEKQGFIEGRIQELEDKLARADVIDPKSLQGDKVMFGATVVLVTDDGDEKTYQIVGDPEADLKTSKISVASPLARALIGKRAGDEVALKSPKGETHYTIEKVEFK